MKLSSNDDKMKSRKIQGALENIAKDISLSQLAKSVGKDRTWLYHKMRNDIVNGVQYQFSTDECELLASELDSIAERIKQSAHTIRQVAQRENRSKGRYYTNFNVFEYSLVQEWFANIPNIEETKILEPFAGECSIPKMLPNYKWSCFDVEPHKGDCKVIKRDTIYNFPKGYRVCVTNPPYLAKNSATRRRLQYPDCEFDNIYKYCLKLMLDNCQYVAAIIPDSFIQSGLFTDRLYGVISLPEKVFEDTEYPVCLAMFMPSKTEDFHIWNGDSVIGTYLELSKYDLSEYNDERWRFNDANGEIGIVCSDGKVNKIRFVKGDDINTEIKGSNRFLVRISGLPEGVDSENFIERCNCILEQYRNNTKDVFLNSFKGLRSDGTYRKRIPFKIVRSILTYALQQG